MSIEHKVSKSGLKKEITEKISYLLIPWELLKELATQFSYGAKKYGIDNWRNCTKEESIIFKQAAFRHFMQWIAGEKDENHLIACVTNMFMWQWVNIYKKDETTKNS